MKNSAAFDSPRWSWRLIGVLPLLILVSIPVSSQAVYGSLLGTVNGSSGEAIRDATITVTSVEKGTKERVTASSSGFFNITHLLSDTYNIRAEAPGYKPCDVPGQEVYADQAVNLELHLEKGVGPGAVQLSESGSLLKTDRADVSITLSAKEVRDLPNFNRNFTAFELLAPGALSSPTVGNTAQPSQNPQQGLQIDQNGQLYNGSAFQLDGTDNRDPIAGLIIINPPLEAISEIKITTQNFDAEFGQALAGLVTAQTRSGSNTWHGSLFEFWHSSWAKASPPHLENSNVTNVTGNPFKINQFGGSLGGPLVANRLFIFGDYQGNRRALDFTRFSNVPTELARSTCLNPSQDCDLSNYGKSISYPIISGDNNSGRHFKCTKSTGEITDMCIPRAFVAPQAMNLLQLLPAPNTGASDATVQNFESTGAEPWNDDEFDTRVDYNLSPKLKLFGRYSFFDSRIDEPGVFGNLLGGPGLGSDVFAGSSRSRDQSISSGFDYLLSPLLTTDFRFGFYRYHVHVLQGGLNTIPATDAGITGLNLGNIYTSGMPGFFITQPAAAVNSNIEFGYSQAINNCNCPLLENEQQFQWANNWTKIRGNHTFKWGVDFRYAQNLRVPSDKHRSGDVLFNPTTTGLGLASFLEGYSSPFDRYVGTDFTAGERQHRYFFYGQDTWRVNSRFTLNYGLRWEIYDPESVTGPGQGGFLDVNTGFINVAGMGHTNLQGNVQNSLDNFAPRLGFAYHALPHTVIRAAYGRSFDIGSLGSVFGDTVTQNPPVLESEQLLPDFPGQEVFNLRQPAPPPASLPIVDGQIKLLKGIAANVVPTRMRIPTIDAWNFSVQQEINPKTSMELAYVANKGTHVFPEGTTASYNLNQGTIQGFETLDPTKCAPTAANPTATDLKLPCISLLSTRQPFFSRFKWTQQINYYGNNASDSYESFQAKFERRFTHSFQFRAAYTWAKGLGYAQDYFAVDPRVYYGPNGFDRTHSFVLSTLWELPIGRGKRLFGNTGGWLNRAIGGWELNTVSYVYSGLPFTPTYSACAADVDVDTGPCRPNLVGPVHVTGNRNDYFTTSPTLLSAGKAMCSPDPDCKAPNTTIVATPGEPSGPWQRPAPGTFGNVGPNSLRGPAFFDTDAALLKNLVLTERFALQFRAVVTNVFNWVNLGLPNACVDCQPIDGKPTSGVIANLANGATMRQFEFALRVQF